MAAVWMGLALVASMLAGCAAEEERDCIAAEQFVTVEFLATRQVVFSIGELPFEVRHQLKLLITAYGDPRGLVYWVAPAGPGEATRCSSGPEPRTTELFCSRLLSMTANSSDSFWVKGEASGQYDVELALLDVPEQSDLHEAPVCKRVVRVEVAQ